MTERIERKKIIALLGAAVFILLLFLAKGRCGGVYETSVVEPEAEPVSPYVTICEFDSLFRVYADTAEFDWLLLAAVAYTESKFDTGSFSQRGAAGLMQIMPSTYREELEKLNLDTNQVNTETNIMIASHYLGSLNRRFHFINKEERLNYMLASYNCGAGHIFDAMRLARAWGVNRYSWSSLSEVLELMDQVSVYTDTLCRLGKFDATETLNYVSRVSRKYREYEALQSDYSKKLQESGRPLEKKD